MSWVQTLKDHAGPIWLHNETGAYRGRCLSAIATKEIPVDGYTASLMLAVYECMNERNRERFAAFDVAVALDFTLKVLE